MVCRAMYYVQDVCVKLNVLKIKENYIEYNRERFQFDIAYNRNAHSIAEYVFIQAFIYIYILFIPPPYNKRPPPHHKYELASASKTHSAGHQLMLFTLTIYYVACDMCANAL